MGYDIHITRQDNWYDENDRQRISLDEWKVLLTKDIEMRLDNFAEATTSSGDSLRVESEGLAIWTKYSENGTVGNYAWFDYHNGNITVKNPDNEIISKMLDISERLNAKVQGDEGEVYARSIDNKIIYKHAIGDDIKAEKQKPWWKFW